MVFRRRGKAGNKAHKETNRSFMANFTNVCPHCGQHLEVPREMAGQAFECPLCNNRFRISMPRSRTQSHPMRVAPTNTADERGAGNGKSWLTTLLLCLFLGWLGIHRFYTGHTGIGIVQLLTGGVCGIWAFVDFVMILTRSYKDASGNKLV